jgi:hypothetical protein
MRKNGAGMIKVWSMAVLLCIGVLIYPTVGWGAKDYHVGPGQPYTTIGSVPWYNLQAGDTVYIHYKSTPYYEKFLISGRGTATQWIQVLGVPGPNGELPVISGSNATTSTNMHYRWQTASGDNGIQWSGVIQISVRADDPHAYAPIPAYIEIANLQVQDGYKTYRFTAENGVSANYDGFAACVYARSVQHLIIRNNVLTNCGQGFYNWTGSGSDWWDGLQADTIIRGNYFYNNGNPNSYTEHQSYTESDRVVYEYNRFGPMRPGALGSQLKDRSAGTVVRYNYIEQPVGWMLDLVEAENGAPTISSRPYYMQTFVYGNVLLNTAPSTTSANAIHWNGDHGPGGRADIGGKLFFYNNTFVMVRNESDIWKFPLFHVQQGGFSCPASVPGVIDARNNIWVNLPRTPGAPTGEMFLAGCGIENFLLGNNWISPGWTYAWSAAHSYRGTTTGAQNLFSPAENKPGFVNMAANDVHLAGGSSAIGIGGSLALEVTNNALGLDLTPTQQYVYHQQTTARSASGAGSDVGAFQAVDADAAMRRTPNHDASWFKAK